MDSEFNIYIASSTLDVQSICIVERTFLVLRCTIQKQDEEDCLCCLTRDIKKNFHSSPHLTNMYLNNCIVLHWLPY